MSTREVRRALLTQNVLKSNALMETELAKVLKDAYPKAQCHFLIIPKEDIVDVYALTRDHIPLLDHMQDLANQIIEQQNLPSRNFLIGFKQDALICRLAMHVVSDDFYSESMKRGTHWNSFHTDLFLTYQALYALLLVNGSVEPMSAEMINELRSTKLLQCNQCDFKSESLLLLKVHLFEHWKAREKQVEIKNQVDKVINMLGDSKLDVDSTKDVPEISQIEQTLIEQPTNWRQQSNLQENNINNNAEHIKPREQPMNWRQDRGSQPTDQQMPGSYYNAFAKHFQKQNNRQAANVQPQERQNFINNRPEQQLNYPQPELNPFIQAPLQAYPVRANSVPNNYQNGGFRPQQFAPNGQNRMPRANNFIRMSSSQHQQNPRYPLANRMQFANEEQQEQGNSQPNRPHFNPFRQAPNVEHVGPTQNNSFMSQHKQNQNLHPSATRPNENKQNKPNWKPKPPYNHAQNMNNKGPGKSASQNHEHPNSNSTISNNVSQPNPSDSASNNKGQAQTGFGKPYKKKFTPKQKENNQNPQK